MAPQYLDPRSGWLLPVQGGIITQGYGPENTDPSVRHLYLKGYHTGVDIAGVPEGTDVIAPFPGAITIAGVFEGKGNCVALQREDNVLVLFGHLSRIDVRVDQKVSPGDVLGGVGNTGVSEGVHLHYEFRVGGTDVDPVPFIMPAVPSVGFKAVVREDLNLRAGPSKNDAIILTAPAGTPVVIGKAGWVPVTCGGREGWMYAEFLNLPAPPAVAGPPAPGRP